ncbi:PucR family transcriptional regulator [Amycolatopsis cihanbeyliensis]|uniref:CdaR family transcriptional regulator n=1 Tax=Amycolatopsis cihanbeyliensis TaxID=1128664 RepID=A0A542DBX0_AMYCI|nr:helix-turn-helix domain-containing protein [Amycolatopsis cihanbeyliensis]TQJ00568.1 CdaR family transcriptional regulator [Amycolatopsis cihanbeyliensis]
MSQTVDAWVRATTDLILDRVDELGARLTESIRTELPVYQTVPADELQRSVTGQVALALAGVRDGETPGPAQLAAAEEWGRRAGEQGVAVSALMQAYEKSFAEVWQAFAEQAGTRPEAARALVELAPVIWSWVHQFGRAAAEGHQVAVTSRLIDDARARQQFIQLVTSAPGSADCAKLGGELGFGTDGPFRALAFTAADSGRELNRLHLRLQHLAGPCIAAPHETHIVVLSQRAEPDEIATLVRPMADGQVLGLGRRRSGLAGARISIGDAELALPLAGRLGHDIDFGEHWLLAILYTQLEHLDELDTGVRAATDHPHLADTVRAFADTGLSAAAAARAQHLHANSVAYRLQRWQDLTGWSVHTFDGLTRSVVAIRLAGVITR